MKKKAKKLSLSRETLRDMDDKNMREVVGGDSHQGTRICSECTHCGTVCTTCDPPC